MVGRIEGRALARTIAVAALLALAPALGAATAGPAAAATHPAYVGGSAASGFAGPASYASRTVRITSSNVQPGDLWIGLAGYRYEGTVSVAGSGWNRPDTRFAGGPGEIYSTRGSLFWKVLTAGDVVNGTFTATVTTSADDATYGGLRVAGAAYRGTNLTAYVYGTATAQSGSLFSSTASVTFPAVPYFQGDNVTVRLGAGRGYGGWLAGHQMHWTSAPGTTRVESDAGNTGDRALVISDQDNASTTTAGGSYDTATLGVRYAVTYTVAITTAL